MNTIDILLNKNIVGTYNLSVKSDIDYELDDTIIIKLDNYKYLQLLIDNHNLTIHEILKERFIILGEDSHAKVETKLLPIEKVDKGNVYTIVNYNLTNYTFATKLLNKAKDYIFGFVYGFDEIRFIKNEDFISMLSSFTEYEEIIFENRIDI